MPSLIYEGIYSQICNLSPITRDQWKEIEPFFIKREYGKNDPVEQTGKQSHSIHILLSGSVRLFYLTKDGKDFNHAFKFEGDIFASYSSLLAKTPSKFSIYTMEKTTLLSIEYKYMVQHFDKYKEWERLGRLIAETHYLTKENREYSFLIESAEERYRNLLNNDPNLISRVPQYHLATFLGINPSSLNRIIKSNIKE